MIGICRICCRGKGRKPLQLEYYEEISQVAHQNTNSQTYVHIHTHTHISAHYELPRKSVLHLQQCLVKECISQILAFLEMKDFPLAGRPTIATISAERHTFLGSSLVNFSADNQRQHLIGKVTWVWNPSMCPSVNMIYSFSDHMSSNYLGWHKYQPWQPCPLSSSERSNFCLLSLQQFPVDRKRKTKASPDLPLSWTWKQVRLH